MQMLVVSSILRRRFLPILACLLAGGLGGFLVARNTPNMYRASATLIINIPQASTSAEALQGVQLSSQLLASYVQVATSRSAAEKVRALLGLSESPDLVRANLAAAPVPETLLLTISATDPDPARAASLADAASRVFIDSVAALERNKTDKVTPSVVDPAIASGTPFSPRPKVDLALGLFTGLIAAGLVTLALEAVDRSVKGPSQLAELSQGPILGIIPRLNATSRFPLTTVENPVAPASEAYRSLRTAIRFLDPDSPLHTILVTSSGPGEGKTTTASHLAVALAQSGERVVLVDADLRRGTLFDLLGLPAGAGITSLVTGAASLDEVLCEWHDTFTALGTGPLPPNPSEILGSQAMAGLLGTLREIADVVVIDAPPVLPVTDAVALSTQVDGVVFVARDGRTNRQSITEARRRLDAVGANVVGCVLNAAKSKSDLYADYRYLRPQGDSSRKKVSSLLRRE